MPIAVCGEEYARMYFVHSFVSFIFASRAILFCGYHLLLLLSLVNSQAEQKIRWCAWSSFFVVSHTNTNSPLNVQCVQQTLLEFRIRIYLFNEDIYSNLFEMNIRHFRRSQIWNFFLNAERSSSSITGGEHISMFSLPEIVYGK